MLHERVVPYYAALPEWAQLVLAGLGAALAVYVLGAVARRVLLPPATRRLDATLRSFLDNLVAATLWILVIVAALLGFGVPATALAGLLAVFGFVVGFALQDTFGNLAAGVLLLVNRPYAVGESVRMVGEEGTVESLGISMTRLRTWDGRMLVVPNGAVIGGPIINFTRNPTRRVEVTVGVGYDDPVDEAMQAILRVLHAESRVLKDPAPDVVVTGLGESSVDLKARAWVPTPEYLAASSAITAHIKSALTEAGVSIPFPQRELSVTIVGGDATPLAPRP